MANIQLNGTNRKYNLWVNGGKSTATAVATAALEILATLSSLTLQAPEIPKSGSLAM